MKNEKKFKVQEMSQEIQDYIAKLEAEGRVRPVVGVQWVRNACTIDEDKNLTPTAIQIYNKLLDKCNFGNIITISLHAVMELVNRSYRAVYNGLLRLEECGYIDKIEKKHKTEVNTFHIFKILPDKKRIFEQFNQERKLPSIDLPQALAQDQAQASKPIKLRKAAPPKARYGQYGCVTLTADEYDDLVQSFGLEKVLDYIQRADNYSMEHHKHYKNNAKVIRKWIIEDQERAEHQYQQRRFGHLFNSNSGNSGKSEKKRPQEELESYLKLGIRFRDPNTMPEEPPKPKYVPVHYDYELTDEEIEKVLNNGGDCSFIWDDKKHPLYECGYQQLYEWATILQNKRKAEKLEDSAVNTS